jgi:iron complex outermembrane receptor protein
MMPPPRSVRFALAPLALTSICLATPARAQQPARSDSAVADSAQRLETIEVTVTRTTEPLTRVPAAVSVLDTAEIRRAQPTLGLDEALNDLPGVFVANRYNFSLDQRVSIRGFGSRANFGTRGLKVLLDGVPQTLPDGQSQLTNVEFGNIGRIEVLRGSASSLYGNASGGVISLQTEAAGPGPFAQYARVEGGSFGLFKWQTRTQGRLGTASGSLSLSRTLWDGFRTQSAADLRLLNAAIDYAISGTDLLTFRFAAADNPKSQNPGALTPAEYAANPDSASASNIRRGADKDVTQQQLALGWKRVDYHGNEYAVTAYGFLRDLTNPLATPAPQGPGATIGIAQVIDRAVGGARATVTRHVGTGRLAPRLTAGVDYQYLRDDRTTFRTDAGALTDSVYVDQRETVSEVGPFVQANWNFVPAVLATLGARYDRTAFGVTDHHLTDGGDNSGSRTMDSWSGNAGVSYLVNDAFIPYVNVASSFETPTTTELGNRPDGSGGFDADLGPQRAWTYEVGARGRIGNRVEYTAAGFLGRVSDAIVQFTEIGGRAFFRNAGKTHNDGIELGVSVRPIDPLRFFGSYTWGHYVFADYKVESGTTVDTLDGNRLPGVPEHFARIGMRADIGRGLAVDVDHTLSSSLFADDDNTVLIDGWGAGVTNVRVSWRGELSRALVAPFIGVNNLFDKRYIGSVTINGFDRLANAPRVIEPAPGINVYVGGEVGFRVAP